MTTNKAPEVNLRNIVLNMLLENNKGRLSHLIVKDTLDENKNLDKNQRAFITRLFQGTIERTIEEDYIINLFSKTKVNKMKPVIRYILRMSVYQLKYMDSVPESAVCNEAVKLAKKRKFCAQTPGFPLKRYTTSNPCILSRDSEDLQHKIFSFFHNT